MLASYQDDVDLTEAEQCYQTSLIMFQSLDEPKSEADVHHQLGRVYQEAKNWELAEKHYREAANIKETENYLESLGGTWNNLGQTMAMQDKFNAAESWFRKVIAAKNSVSPKELICSLNSLATMLQNKAEHLTEARQLVEDSLIIQKDLGEESMEIWKTYSLLAEIVDKQQGSQANEYRQISRDRYLNFNGMPHQTKRHEKLITDTIFAVLNNNQSLESNQFLIQLPEDMNNVAYAISEILRGERDKAVLLEPLDYVEAAITHLILKGIESPESRLVAPE